MKKSCCTAAIHDCVWRNSSRHRTLMVMTGSTKLVLCNLAVREKWFHTCDLVVNGEEVLSAVEHQKYDLLLMDCQMPEMDGFTATREIRKREESGQLSGHLPIIALTANALKGDRERCLETGMDEYIMKPIEVDALQAVMRNILQ